MGNSRLLTSGAVTFWQKGEDPPAETLGRPTGLGTENKLYLATPKLKQSLNREGQMQLDKAETQSQEQKKKKKKKNIPWGDIGRLRTRLRKQHR